MTTKRRILLIGTGDGTIGGTERVICNLAHSLTDRGQFVQTIFPKTDKSASLLEWCKNQGVEAQESPNVLCVTQSHSWRMMLALLLLIRHYHPDIVNIHYGSPYVSLKDVLAVRFAGVRRCYVTVHQAADLDQHKREMTRKAANYCSGVIAICEAVSRMLASAGVAKSKLNVLYCGVRPPLRFPIQDDARQTLNIPAEAFVIVCVASLTKRKGVADLITAVSLLDDPKNKLQLVIVGDGPEYEALKSQASTSLGSRAMFLGQVNGDMADIYSCADIFALTSYREGLPLVYIEAAFHGVPSIGTDVDGTHEVIEDGKTGLLVSSGSPSAVADALRRLHDNPLLRQRLGEDARTRAFAEFTETAMAKRYSTTFKL